jgi:phosphoenolpyruvate carboxylase
VRHALFYFDQSIFAVTARLYRDLSTALDRTNPSLATTPFLFLTFGSWVGGDRSGNPRVTPQVIGQTLRMHRALALSKYMESVQHLLGLITPSTVLVQASPALLASLERDVQAFGAVGRGIRAAWSDELYRQKLDFILRRLQNTYARNGAHWTGEALEATGRPGPG